MTTLPDFLLALKHCPAADVPLTIAVLCDFLEECGDSARAGLLRGISPDEHQHVKALIVMGEIDVAKVVNDFAAAVTSVLGPALQSVGLAMSLAIRGAVEVLRREVNG